MSKQPKKQVVKLSKIYKPTEANETKLKEYIYGRYYKGVKITRL